MQTNKGSNVAEPGQVLEGKLFTIAKWSASPLDLTDAQIAKSALDLAAALAARYCYNEAEAVLDIILPLFE